MLFRAVLSLLSLFLMTVAFSASAGDLVVISGGTPDLQPGQIVNSNTPLTIPAGSTITLVSGSGKTLTLKGPHTGTISLDQEGAGSASLISSLSSLLAGPGKETSSLGVMRALAPPPLPTDPWVIDIGQSGDHCVAANGPARLWRGKNAKAWVVSLKNLTDKSKSSTKWPAGTRTLNWPSEVALVDGARYLLRKKGSRATKKFTMHLVPGDLPTTVHKVAWMAEKGCKAQAKLLLARIR